MDENGKIDLINIAVDAGWDRDKADEALRIWGVDSMQDLYAKFVAIGRDAALFADAIGVSTGDVQQLMIAIRAALPDDVLEELEMEVPVMPFGAKKPFKGEE